MGSPQQPGSAVTGQEPTRDRLGDPEGSPFFPLQSEAELESSPSVLAMQPCGSFRLCFSCLGFLESCPLSDGSNNDNGEIHMALQRGSLVFLGWEIAPHFTATPPKQAVELSLAWFLPEKPPAPKLESGSHNRSAVAS